MDIKTLLLMTLLSIIHWDCTGASVCAFSLKGITKAKINSNRKQQNEPYRIRPPPPE